MDTIWNLMNMITVIFRIMGIGMMAVVITVMVTNENTRFNRIVKKVYDRIIGDMFMDETLE